MSFEIESLFAGVTTLWAAERLFIWMSPHVYLEVTFCFARITTLIAFERLFSWVFTNMLFEKSRCSAGVAALVAIVGLLFILQRFFQIHCHFDFLHCVGFSWWQTELKRISVSISVIWKWKWSQCQVVIIGDYVPMPRDLHNVAVMVTNTQRMVQGMLSLWRKFWRSGMYVCVWCIFHRCLSND